MRIDNNNIAAATVYKKAAPQPRDNKRDRTDRISDTKLQALEKQPEAEISIELDTSRDQILEKSKSAAEYYGKLSEELEKAQEQSDAAGEAFKELILCLRIAMRIISGNKVPIEDQQFLLEKDPELYSKAMMMKVRKSDPEEYDRLTEDEEEESSDSPESAASQLTGAEPDAQPGAEMSVPEVTDGLEAL